MDSHCSFKTVLGKSKDSLLLSRDCRSRSSNSSSWLLWRSGEIYWVDINEYFPKHVISFHLLKNLRIWSRMWSCSFSKDSIVIPSSRKRCLCSNGNNPAENTRKATSLILFSKTIHVPVVERKKEETILLDYRDEFVNDRLMLPILKMSYRYFVVRNLIEGKLTWRFLL